MRQTFSDLNSRICQNFSSSNFNTNFGQKKLSFTRTKSSATVSLCKRSEANFAILGPMYSISTDSISMKTNCSDFEDGAEVNDRPVREIRGNKKSRPEIEQTNQEPLNNWTTRMNNQQSLVKQE